MEVTARQPRYRWSCDADRYFKSTIARSTARSFSRAGSLWSTACRGMCRLDDTGGTAPMASTFAVAGVTGPRLTPVLPAIFGVPAPLPSPPTCDTAVFAWSDGETAVADECCCKSLQQLVKGRPSTHSPHADAASEGAGARPVGASSGRESRSGECRSIG